MISDNIYILFVLLETIVTAKFIQFSNHYQKDANIKYRIAGLFPEVQIFPNGEF